MLAPELRRRPSVKEARSCSTGHIEGSSHRHSLPTVWNLILLDVLAAESKALDRPACCSVSLNKEDG
jgi:hypothetical protein